VNIYNGLITVNKSLYQTSDALPAKASDLLYSIESCLCSGDGLSAETAFRAADGRVIERVLGVLGVVRADDRRCTSDGIRSIPLAGNLFGVRRVFFAII
jgi:hypothetical protein